MIIINWWDFKLILPCLIVLGLSLNYRLVWCNLKPSLLYSLHSNATYRARQLPWQRARSPDVPYWLLRHITKGVALVQLWEWTGSIFGPSIRHWERHTTNRKLISNYFWLVVWLVKRWDSKMYNCQFQWSFNSCETWKITVTTRKDLDALQQLWRAEPHMIEPNGTWGLLPNALNSVGRTKTK